MAPPGHYDIIWAAGSITPRLGDGPPQVTQGYSRFEEIARPKRGDVVEFVGASVYKMTIPSVFDGWSDENSAEPGCAQLESLASPEAGLKPKPPQSFRLQGPIPHTDLEWFVESIEWGDAIYAEGQNIRLRQFFSLSVIQKADMPAVLGNERLQDLRKIRTVKSGTGDLRELAQLVLGDSTLWRRFTDTKGRPFRDWKQKRGIKVRVPQ